MDFLKTKHMNLTVYLLFTLVVSPAFAKEWGGTVVGISDGDTLTVLNSQKRPVKIRLAEIDAPESKQAFGTQSKKSLSDLCFKKTVIVDDRGQDRYKRTLGRVQCDGIDANVEQVNRGMAWAYRKYLTDQSISDLEEKARSNQVGLWAEENPSPPWEFRHGGKSMIVAKADNQTISAKETTLSDITALSDANSCDTKKRCKQMKSCSEAKHYLNDCGLSRLDRDGDGMPCESLCN